MAFVILNSYPGVGKFTVGQILSRTLPNAKLFNNHLLIDAAAALYTREDSEFYTLRKALRTTVFNSLHSSMSAKLDAGEQPIIIFTEAQSTSPKGSEVMQEYLQAANRLKLPLISILLTCSSKENERRLVGRLNNLTRTSTKLSDPTILKTIRETEKIYEYGHAASREIIIDTTGKDAADVASAAEETIMQMVILSKTSR